LINYLEDCDLESLFKDNSIYRNRIFNEGVKIAPLLYFFVYSLVDYAIKNKMDTIYYQTREGETFVKVFDIIASNNPFNSKLPKAKVMEISRMASFAPSLKEFSIDELMRMWSQYKKQSIKTLYKSLNVDIDSYTKYFKKYDIDIDEVIDEPYSNERIKKLFSDVEYKKLMDKELNKKREKFLNFFEHNYGIKNEKGSLLIVDIGWRGSIQDNLAYIYDKKDIYGYYIALFDYFNKQPKNVNKKAFIDDIQVRDNVILNLITLLEWLYNPGTGSVIGYEGNKAIRKMKDQEKSVIEEYIKPLQEGMFEGVKVINEAMAKKPIDVNEMKNIACEMFKDVKENPSPEIVDAYYSMVFNNNFGDGDEILKPKKLSFIDRFNVIKCRNLLRKEDWKEAFMKYNHVGYMKYLLDIAKLIKRKK